jgi:NADH-quinone oxidoreductase subunit G
MADVVKKDELVKAAPATVTFQIDGRTTTVPKGTTVLEAAKQLGINIPTFCWHPKLKSVGACRMCYVEVEKMPKLQVSCMLEAMEGMVVSTNSDKVRQGRRAVIEFILLNHPLDCPTCDKGGECDLQNLTFAHGFDDSRFVFQKYRFVEEEDKSTFDDLRIGPEIVLNRNRCILCYKCVRANKEAFGEYDLGAYERGNITEINAAPGQEVDNPFSGNLVEICPVGALTNTDWRYKIRVWLTKTSPSICNFTSSGSNITFYKEDHRNHIFRVTSRRNDEIDDGWIPDVTRYGYQIVGSPDRLQTPLIKKGGKQVPATWEEALDVIKKRSTEIREKLGGVCLGGIVSPNLDNASLYSFSKLMRTVFKSNNVDYRGDYRMLPAAPDSPACILGSQPFKISDIDDSDVIVMFGSDMVREHPNEYLRVRKARQFGQPRIFSITPYGVKSADVSDLEMIYSPGREEAVINGICLAAMEAGLIDERLGSELKSKITPGSSAEAANIAGVEAGDLKTIAQALSNGKKITIIAGEIVAKSKERDQISAALLNLNALLGIVNKGQMALLPRYANSVGAERLGLVPQPSKALTEEMKQVWSGYPDCVPHNTDAMMALIKKEEIKGFFIFGGNPMMLYPDREFVREALEKLDFLVVADLFETATTEIADVVLPMCSWAEYEGDYINLEGKTQKALRAVKPMHQAKPAYEIVSLIADQFGTKLFPVEKQIESEINGLLKIESRRPVPTGLLDVKPEYEAVPEQFPYAIYLVDDAHHCGHLTEKTTSLVNFCSEPYVELSPDLAGKLDVDAGEPVRLESEVGKQVLTVRLSEHIDNDVVVVPRNFPAMKVNSLFSRKRRVDRVKISKVVE